MKLKLSLFEVVLLTFGAGLFGLGTYWYVTDANLAAILFGRVLQEEGVRAGEIQVLKGKTIRRKSVQDSTFRPLADKQVVYWSDTISTGNDTTVRIDFDDGSTAELEPKSSITLKQEVSFRLTGVERSVILAQTSGKISVAKKHGAEREIRLQESGKTQTVLVEENKPVVIQSRPTIKPVIPKTVVAAPTEVTVLPPAPPVEISVPKPVARVQPTPSPVVSVAEVAPTPSPSPEVGTALASPSPSPTPETAEPPKVAVKVQSQIQFLSPKLQSKVSVPAGSKAARAIIPIHLKVSPPESTLRLRITRAGAKKPEISEQLSLAAGEAKFDFDATSPGFYRIEAEVAAAPSIIPSKQSGQIEVLKRFEGIVLKEGQFAGVPLSKMKDETRNRLIQAFDLRVRWEPFPGAKAYRVRVESKELEGGSKEYVHPAKGPTEFKLTKTSGFYRRLSFSVLAQTGSGFEVTSPTGRFEFDSIPPVLQAPPDLGSWSLAKDLESGGYFTWEKIDFVKSFRFELAHDRGFKNMVQSQELDGNFYPVKPEDLEPGTYFWRVKANLPGESTEFSKVFQLTVKP